MAGAFVTTETNIPTVIAGLDRMEAVAQAETTALLERSAVAVRTIAVLDIASHTPLDDSHDGEHLGQSTRGDVAVARDSALITIRQTKTVPWKGHGDYPLARFIIDGTDPHTIEAPPGHYLFWEGADHPVKRVKHPGFPGRDYPGEAMDEALPAIDAALRAEADAVAQMVARSLAA